MPKHAETRFLPYTPEDRAAGVFAQAMAQAVRRGKADDNRWLLRRDGLRLWAEGVLMPQEFDVYRFQSWIRNRMEQN